MLVSYGIIAKIVVNMCSGNAHSDTGRKQALFGSGEREVQIISTGRDGQDGFWREYLDKMRTSGHLDKAWKR